jgi:signal peptidase I
MNYIKRLIGLPGETIAIRGGKVYYLSADKGLHYDDYEQATKDPEMMALLWQKDPFMHKNDQQAIDRFKQGQFLIIRKSPDNILSMMRLVYDNDHPASKKSNLPDRWISPDRAWTVSEPHGFHIDGADGKDHHLRYRHVLRDSVLEDPPNGKPSLITDVMGYNSFQDIGHVPLPGHNWVGDLILECETTIDNPQGEFTLELSKGVDQFRARWDLATGVCTLLRVTDGLEQKLDSKPTEMNKKGKYHLRFANVDDRLAVWVNGELPFDSGFPYDPAKQLGPVAENDLERPASIGAKGAAVSVRKIKLFRDSYYTVSDHPNEPDVHGITFTDPGTWEGLRRPPLLTMYVQPDHFLCLGDNSPESSDGRSWGTVPKRLMLGRALLVYYPFGRAGRIR